MRFHCIYIVCIEVTNNYGFAAKVYVPLIGDASHQINQLLHAARIWPASTCNYISTFFNRVG